MSPKLLFFIIVFHYIFVYISSFHIPYRTLLQTGGSASCPLDFNVLRAVSGGLPPPVVDTPTRCGYIIAGVHIVEAEYFRLNNSFIPPVDSAESCFQGLQNVVNEFMPNFDLQSSCGFNSTWIVQGCLNITNSTEFESVLPVDVLNDVVLRCNSSLNGSACSDCSSSLQNITSSYFTGDSTGSITSCRDYGSIYAASLGRRDRPIDRTTVSCLFSLDFARFDRAGTSSDNKRRRIIIGVSVGSSVVVCLLVILLLWRKLRRNLRLQNRSESGLALPRFDGMRRSSMLVKFSFKEIEVATNNFSIDNVIGSGGYGNVYKGVLLDGSEVAFKRFKKLSEDGENDFMHELEVIASVRHVNLVALRGYCTVSTKHEGYQRIIICDLMKNGSLYDHLFASKGEKLSWPVRQNIALGTAKGLAYLHYGVQPAIIHRDIKASNILLDEGFEPKVADFGLARFSPDGITHLSTSVAGTIGYVSPEYALYGQLNEKSDVYSFGIVLLELLSGKKAVMAVNNDEPPIILSDWAWSLVGENQTLDVIDENIPHLGPPEVLKKYVLIALICSHPKLSVRPTMDQVVKLLDSDAPLPVIPERPVSLIADLNAFEQSLSSFDSGAYLSTSTSDYSRKYNGSSHS
ncbi:hypothetical protein Leryth_005527 [Lithospermum erythrorhizon]|nr:hypothetical protein Leryth_005527 [Lithospermum erythrorhizon]